MTLRPHSSARVAKSGSRYSKVISGEIPEADLTPLRILMVSTADRGGGAEQSAWNLYRAYGARGHTSWMAVGRKQYDDPNIAPIPNEAYRSRWAKAWFHAAARIEPAASALRGGYRLLDIPRLIGEPRRWLDVLRGYEDFDFPGTEQLLCLFGLPDIVHCYNLHGNYFDLQVLSCLSRQVPVMLDLRDAWLLSGHCAHSFDCDRWQQGCGDCPDLNIYPAIRRDATAFNWQRKKAIFAASRVYVAAPSQWLMKKVEASMLAPAVIEARVIPTGVDLGVYQPAQKEDARAALDLPQDATVLLFASNGVRRNPWKDYETLRAAIGRVAERVPQQKIVFVGLGEDAPPESAGAAQIRFVPHQKTAAAVVRYYQAADLYLHPAKADTFPRAVIEALACGLPVVATGVGGIPEQIKALPIADADSPAPERVRFGPAEATGIIVPVGDVEAMALAIERLVKNQALRCQLGSNGRQDAVKRYDLQLQVNRYLEWYTEITRNARRRQPVIRNRSQLSLGAQS